MELSGLELRARVAAGFFQLDEDVADRGQAELLVSELLGVEALEGAGVADQRADVAAGVGGDALHQRVGFRVHRGGVQRVVAVHYAQEAGGLFEGFVAQARDVLQRGAGLERAVGIAMGDDVLRQCRIQAGDARQQGHRGGVYIDADGVHAVFHHRVQAAGQFQLRHVMLVLADADGFRVDLHQFGQRVLQAAGNGHSATQGYVEVGEFLGSQLGGRVHRGAGLRHHDFGQLQARQLFDQVGGQLVGLAAGGAVADRDQVDLMLGAQLGQGHQGAVPVVARRVRVDGGGVQHLAGGIHYRHLAAGAQARIEGQGRPRAGRRGQQQVVQVASEHHDRFVFGAFAQLAEQVGFQVGVELDLPGPAHHFAQPFIRRTALVADAETLADHALAGVHAAWQLIADFQAGAEEAFVAATEDRQGAVRRHAFEALVMFEVVAKLRPFFFLAGHQARAQGGFLFEEVA